MSTAQSSRVRRSWRTPLLAADAAMTDADPREELLTASRPAGRGVSVREFSRACLLRLIDYPEMPFRTKTGDVVKAGRTALIVRTEFPVAHRMQPAAWKRVTRKNWLKRLTSLFRTNHCLRTFHLGHELLRLGIATARPLAVVLPHRFHLFRDTYIATEWLEGAENLTGYFRALESLSASRRAPRAAGAVVALGTLLGRMHAASISHRDLKAGNLMLRERHEGPQAFVIDLDGATVRRGLSWRVRVRNLARLAACIPAYPVITRSQVLRGLLSYVSESSEPIDWKRLWRDVTQCRR